MVGTIIVRVTFALAVLSSLSYFIYVRKRSERYLKAGRMLYYFAVAGILSGSALLLTLILTHQFQYAYVWEYSSRDLPGPLLFSTVYAGQEGSFNLWAFYTAIIGLILMRYTRNKGYEPELMSIYTLMLSFLLVMLVAKNPFELIWDRFPTELMHVGAIPASVANFAWIDQARGLWAQIPSDGKGLNPLLQNYWMVIHPPILFLGFTSMSVPFAYAIAGMMKRDYVGWIRVATPWTVFGSMALGTGIVLGGYWAYETLGWGGYWGWDPVENSSLVPWLFCVASIHTMLSQRKSGSFIRTTFILSILCYLMVLYSTFLTRSGVLGDTSVHSFVEPGMWVYWLLLLFLATFATIGLTLFFRRQKEMPRVPVERNFLSREFALFLGSAALVFASVFVVIGTSSPIITSILKNRASAVDTSYYVTTTLPLGILIALLSGIGQLLWWRTSRPETFLRSLRIPLIGAFLITIAAIILGAAQPPMLLFIFAAAFALSANLLVGFRIVTGNPRMAGGAIAHIGIALMFLGFVASSKYDNKETVSLEQGKQSEALGYHLTYTGFHPIERGRFAFDVEVQHGDERFVVAPVMFVSQQNDGLIRNPDIINLLTRDFYVSPLSLEQADERSDAEMTLRKGETQTYSGYKLSYQGYEFSMSPELGNIVKANIEVEKGGSESLVVPKMINKQGQVSYVPATIPGTSITLTIKAMNPNRADETKSTLTLAINDPAARASAPPKRDVLVVEASVKPFINFVWLGTVTLIAGFGVTIVRRTREARAKVEA